MCPICGFYWNIGCYVIILILNKYTMSIIKLSSGIDCVNGKVIISDRNTYGVDTTILKLTSLVTYKTIEEWEMNKK